MKKLIALLLAVMMVFSLFACQSNESEAPEPNQVEQPGDASASAPADDDYRWKQIGHSTPEFEAALQEILDNATEDSLKNVLEEGVFHAGVEGNWIPHIYWAEEDQDYLTGFDVWSFREVCALLGVEPDYYVASQWDGMIAGLQADRYDILPECMTKASIENSDDLALTSFYATDSVVIIVAADNTDIVDIASMKGKKAGNSTTSSLGTIAFNAGCECNPDLDFSMAIQGIINGSIDLTVNNLTVYNDYIQTYPEAADKLKIAFTYQTDDPHSEWGAFACRKADASLLAACTLAIDTLMEQDVFKTISAKFYGQSFADTADLYNQDKPGGSAPSASAGSADDFDAALSQIIAEDTDGSLQRVLDAGVLTCGCEGNWIPFLYYDENDLDYLTGYDAEVAREVCKLLGVDVQFEVASQFDGILAGLQAKRYDILSEGLKESTVAPFEGLSCTTKYHQDMPIIIVAADNTDIVDIPSMNGKKAGNSTTSSYGRIAFEAGCECNPDLDFAMAIQGILNGTVDLTVNSMVVFNTYLETYPEAADKLKIAFIYEAANPEDLQGGLTVRTEDVSLTKALNLCLETLMERGVLQELSVKFMGQEYTDNSLVFADYR